MKTTSIATYTSAGAIIYVKTKEKITSAHARICYIIQFIILDKIILMFYIFILYI